MVTLFRGVDRQPVLLTTDVTREKDSTFLHLYGGIQAFSDDYNVALESAGTRGWIIQIELTEKEAEKYSKGLYREDLDPSGQKRIITKYEIPAEELANKSKDWNYSSSHVQKIKPHKEKE